MIKVFLTDDHAIIRDGLKVFLEMQPSIEVIGEASSGVEAVAQVCDLKPDVVVMDISMPDLNGIEATRLILQRCPETKIIILSMLGNSEHVFQALQAGARGYLLKDSATRDVVDAVLTVASGKRYLSETITDTMVTNYIDQHDVPQQKSILENLSQREQEILPLVLEGKTSVEIGKLLFLSPKSVETYRSRILQKLGVKDKTSLMKFAIQHGLIQD